MGNIFTLLGTGQSIFNENWGELASPSVIGNIFPLPETGWSIFNGD
jgi:hypothetical protein